MYATLHIIITEMKSIAMIFIGIFSSVPLLKESSYRIANIIIIIIPRINPMLNTTSFVILNILLY